MLLCLSAVSAAVPSSDSVLQVESGLTDDGLPTERWMAMTRRFAGDEAKPAPLARRPLTPQERSWAELMRARAAAWTSRKTTLEAPFHPVAPPAQVTIVLGNQGGEDAFAHDATTIGFDLSRLQSTYGDASLEENASRADRFLDHEYTHLMQKAWLAGHPFEPTTPLDSALLDIWKEGLGNQRSLSGAWRPSGEKPSSRASEALGVLEPRFVSRMAALACASPPDGAKLTADLSMGRFDAKWGALPAALWLDDEASRDPEALRRFVQAGPAGVWDLAARHLPPALGAALSEARRAAALCAAR